MIHSKRTQIRRDLRHGQLQHLFMLKRKELVHGTIALFRQLDAAIYAQPAISDMELASSLVTCLHNHPEEENAYILVGNYLFHNNHQIGYFFSQLVDTPRYLENQMWCLRVMTSILDHQHQQQEQSQELIHDQLRQIMETACSVVREMSCNLKRLQFSTDKDLKLWFYFMEILKVQANACLQLQFPHQAVSLLREVMALLPVQEDETQYLQYIWWCLKAVLVRIKQTRIREQLFGVSWTIFWSVLKQLPQQREQCLSTMTYLLENYSINFMNIVFHEQIISELLYIFSQLPAHKKKIAYLLKLLVPMCSLDQTMLILNLGSHKVLTEAMEWAMQSYNNACLEDSLAALYFLLERLKDMHQTQLTRRILSEVQTLHFDQMLEGLSQHPQNSTVSKYLNLLIDDFYSDEVL